MLSKQDEVDEILLDLERTERIILELEDTIDKEVKRYENTLLRLKLVKGEN